MTSLRLYIGSLPYQVQAEDIYDLLSDLEIPHTNLDISIDPFIGRNPGYVFVDVPDQNAYDSAMERLPGQLVRGRSIKVNAAGARKSVHQDGTKAKSGSWRSRDGGDVRGTGGHGDGRGMTDLSGGPFAFNRWTRGETEAPERWDLAAKENHCVFVGGLPRIRHQSMAQDVIRNRIFGKYEVEAISKIIYPHEGMRCRPGNQHYAFVDLPSEVEAKAAVQALDGSWYEDSVLRVKMAYMTAAPKVIREQLAFRPAEV